MAAQSDRPDDIDLSLSAALVTSSPAPILLLDGDRNIVAASTSFQEVFLEGQAIPPGQPLFTLGAGEWEIPQLRTLIDATASQDSAIDAYEMQLKPTGRPAFRLVVQARRLEYLDIQHTRILLAVSDVTAAKADEKLRNDAIQQNSVLLQEVRHRVANSLQIIASVLLQTAKRTKSEETRGHLKDAHHRVMSVAALERQLSASEDGDVEVHTYFTRLCDSIAVAMISDHDRITLTVEGGPGVVEARTSVSLGLIVTELVINALKHAFPDGRPGRITVDYGFHGPNWVLCVMDDGVGMRADPTQIQAGLGTSIVRALANQLDATVEVTSAHPGTKVSIAHTPVALVDADPLPTPPLFAVKRPAA
jgi:two-component sensor histidine kinase